MNLDNILEGELTRLLQLHTTYDFNVISNITENYVDRILEKMNTLDESYMNVYVDISKASDTIQQNFIEEVEELEVSIQPEYLDVLAQSFADKVISQTLSKKVSSKRVAFFVNVDRFPEGEDGIPTLLSEMVEDRYVSFYFIKGDNKWEH